MLRQLLICGIKLRILINTKGKLVTSLRWLLVAGESPILTLCLQGELQLCYCLSKLSGERLLYQLLQQSNKS